MVKVNFSWDDGSIYDFKIAQIFLKRNLKTTFFIPTKNPENKYLRKNEIEDLTKSGMIIGGHTSDHVYLNKIDRDLVEGQMISNKHYLEDICQNSIDLFCYPGGRYDKFITSIAMSNFKKARTADTLYFKNNYNFNQNTTFHFYDRGFKSLIKNSIINNINYFPYLLRNYNKDYFQMITKIILDLNNSNNNLNLSIWGHGWELENYSLFSKLEDFIDILIENNICIEPFE